MCYRVDCRQCGKYTWGGCGKHLSTLYASIDVGKHCMCRSWPGVVIPSTTNATNNNNNQQPATPVSGYSFSLTFWQPAIFINAVDACQMSEGAALRVMIGLIYE
ncbi:hypothetical protein J1N35_021952 [Gossypium stocksii]|uniref:Uncharacterized protein n=1 Tax=Gossypium stocksii TaxID=47602 RepID=A0A9D4A0N6_9ROSI|nr:hypothetical protein J1N35_021952 [Gossypium stocksii]